MIPWELQVRRKRELESDLAARFPSFSDQLELRRLQADPLVGPVLALLHDVPGSPSTPDDEATIRHALSGIVPFTQNPSAFGAEPPAVEPSPIWPRWWATNELGEQSALFRAALFVGLGTGATIGRAPSEVTAELDEIALAVYGVTVTSGGYTGDPSLHAEGDRPDVLADKRARYRRLHDQLTARVQGEAVYRSMAKDSVRRDLIATVEAALANGNPDPMDRFGLLAVSQHLRAIAVAAPRPDLVERVASVVPVKYPVRPILADQVLAVELATPALRRAEIVRAPHWLELPLARMRVGTRTGRDRAAVPRSRNGYAFPLAPGYLDIETDENSAQNILADDGLEILDLSAIERENQDLKKRLAVFEKDAPPTAEMEREAAKARAQAADAQKRIDALEDGRPTRARTRTP